MRNVTIVVAVLMTSCQVSLKPNTGPATIQSRMTSVARANAIGWPVQRAVCLEKRSKNDVRCVPGS
jgi:hypothetical protein